MRVLRHLIPLRLNEAELAQVAYLAKPPPLRVAWQRLPGLLAVAVLGALAGGIVALRTRNLDDEAFEVFRTKLEAVRNDKTLGPRESAQALYLGHSFFEAIGNMPLITNVSAARYFFSLALVRKLLARWAPELGPNAAATLCTGTPGMRSVQMSRDIEALGQLALNNDHVKTVLINSTHVDANTVASLRTNPDAAAFCTAFETFLGTHGHRTTRELELASARWHEAPHTVLAMVRNQIVAKTANDNARPEGPNHTQRREALAQRLRDALDGRPLERALGVRARVLNALIATTGYYAKLRENTRYYHIMVVDVVREKVLGQATALLERGMLTHRDDAFFLTAWELDELAASRTADEVSAPDIHKIIERRRAKHRHNTGQGAPKTLGFELPAPSASGNSVADGILTGHVASPGQCRGRARVMLDPSKDANLEPGEILVAPYTDPAWTPLFLTAGAAVVEVGSYLSHAGTVARELGLPCIVDVDQCTRRIRTGDLLEVDAHRGEIRILLDTEPVSPTLGPVPS
jgi:pyruvate,water dikinase